MRNLGKAHLWNLTLSNDILDFSAKLATGSPHPEDGQALTHT